MTYLLFCLVNNMIWMMWPVEGTFSIDDVDIFESNEDENEKQEIIHF